MSQRWQAIQESVTAAAGRSGRDPGAVTVIAVSKTQAVEDILRAYDLGIRNFGENRFQEALPKMERLPSDIVWHFIGGLQSNKAKRIAESFQAIHSIDSAAHVREISKASCSVLGFLQVNVGREPQKSGVLEEDLDTLLANVLESQQIRLLGLMAIPPVTADAEEGRKAFRDLAKMARERGLDGLSMGMSGDFEAAIEEGATHVRIGTALFGSRI